MRAFRFAAVAVAVLLAQGCDSVTEPTPDPSQPVPPAAGPALFPVHQGGDHLLIDATGRVVVALDDYSDAQPGREGLTPARKWTGRTVWDFYDGTGRVAFTVAADEVDAPRDGLVRVRVDGRSGFVDLTGAYVVNPYLNDARSLAEGFARVKTTGWQWGLMDRTGRVAVQPEWGELADVSGGMARFKEGDLYGFIDTAGREAIAPVYADARSFKGGLAAVREGQRWFYIDAANVRTMGSTTFISAGDFADGLAPVRTGNRWEYIDATGARVIDPQFEDARAFAGGFAAVRVDGAWTFIDRTGRQLRAPSFDEVDDFEGGLARVTVGGKEGYIDGSGAYVWIPR